MTIEQFGKAIVASGLMTADDVKAFWAAIPADGRPKNGDGFGKLLVDKSLLTPFHVAELLAGRGARLMMGDYTIVAQIGAGGMGQVYKAQHRRMKRTVALKVMSNAAMQDEAAVKRFQREVHAAAKLEHPNIVTAYDSGEAGSVKYLVMQFVDGGDLSELVKKQGRLGIEQAVGYVIQAAKGLAFAHGEGVIHRDIKPANLLLDKKGVVKILDMGLARFEDGGDGLTATEQVMGTVDYMSPEQAANTKGCDGRADIYSLGCTLWYLLTGKKLYEADTLIARLMLHRDGPLPSLVKERDDAPWPLEQTLHRMIAKRVQDRFQSMDEVVAALAPFSGDAASSGSIGGASSGGGPSADLASFMQSMGGGGTKTNISATQQVAGTKPATSANIDATAQFSAPDAGTDPKSQVLPKTSARPKPALAKKPGKPGNNRTKLIAAGALGGVLLLVGIIVKIRDKDGNVVAEVNAPTGASAEIITTPQPAVRPNTPAIPVTPVTLPIAQLLDSPDYVWGTPENLGSNVNSTSDDWKPTLTADELRMVFRGDGGASQNSSSLWECRRASIDEPFGPRARLTGSAYEDEPFLSGDGLTLLFDTHAVASGRTAKDIRVRRRLTLDAPWAKPESLPLAEDRDEQSPWLSPDELTLIYATSGGLNGSRDLWICNRATPNARFGPSTNFHCGANSPASENCPQLLSDGRTILFSRDGKPHVTFTSQTGVLSALQLLGITEDVRDAWLSNDGRRLYFNSKRAGGLGGYDIWLMRLMPKGSATPSVPSFVASVSPSFTPSTTPATPPPPGDYALRFVQYDRAEAPNPQLDESQPFTVEAYITPGDADPNNSHIGVRLFGVDAEFHFEIKDSRWRFYSTHNEALSPEQFKPRRRVHVAGVRTTTGRLLYLDGKLVASKDDPLKLMSKESETSLLLEARGAVEMTYDEIRISQGIVYDKEFAPPAKLTADKSTLALYHFDEGFGDVLKDSSGKGRDGKINGATWVKADGSPIPTDPTSTVPISNGVVYLVDMPEKSYFGHGSLAKPSRNPVHADSLSKDYPGTSPLHTMFVHLNETKHDKLTDAKSPHNISARIAYDLGGNYASFQAGFRARSERTIVAEIWGDGKRLWESGGFVPHAPAGITADVDVRGVRELTLLFWSDASSIFAVQSLLLDPRLTPVTSAPQIPTEAVTFGGHSYLLVDSAPGKKLKWNEAKARSEAMGGHLATVNSRAELEWMQKTFRNVPAANGLDRDTYRLWLGGINDIQNPDRWTWVTGEPFDRALWQGAGPGDAKAGISQGLSWYGLGWDDAPEGTFARFFLVEWDTAGAAGPQAGPQAADHALQFDGKTAHVTTPILHVANTPLTIEVTLRPGPVRGAIISNSEGSGLGLDIVNGAPNFLAFRRSSGTESYARATAPQPLDMSLPHRLAAVYDGAKIRLYVDGKLAATSDLGGEYLPSDLPFILGASPEGQGIDYPFTGTLDEVRFSKSARYAADYTPPGRLESDPDTLALYHFDEGLGDVLKDASGQGHDGKIVAAKWVKVDTKTPVNATPIGQPPAAAFRWPLAATKPEEIAWLKSLNAQLVLRNGTAGDRTVPHNDPLPPGSWTVVGIHFHRDSGPSLDDQSFGRIAALTDLEMLRGNFPMPGTKVTREGFQRIRALVNLRELQLGHFAPPDADPTIFASFPQLETLKLMNMRLVGWEPHVPPSLRELTLYYTDDAKLDQLGVRPQIRELRFAGYQTNHSVRLAATKAFAAANPWCRITYVGLDGDNMKELIVEPTAPPPPVVGAPLDLLPLVDLSQDVLSGEWSQEGAGLVNKELKTNSWLRLPVEPGEAYSLRAAFSTDSGNVSFILPFESKGLEIFLSTKRVEACLKPLNDPTNPTAILPITMNDAQRHEALFEVTRPSATQVKIAVSIDGAPALQWQGTLSQLQAIDSRRVLAPTLSVGSFLVRSSPMRLLEAQLTTTQGVTKPLRGTLPTAVAPAVDDQAAVAKWLLDNKKLARIRVLIDGRDQLVATVPTGPFKVVELNFSKSNNGGQPLTEEDVARLAVFTDVKSLELSTLTDAGLAKLAPLKKLKTLIVNGSTLTPAAVATIRQFPELEHLRSFGDDEWLKALAGTPTLRSMEFWRDKVSSQAMSLFPQYPNLKELTFFECVEDENATSFVAIAPLKDCKNLSRLTLHGGAVDGAELAVLSGFTQLLELNLNTPSITEPEVQRLAAALPRCKITWKDATNQPHVFEPTAPPDKPR